MSIKVLANLHLPSVEGFTIRTFGNYPDGEKNSPPWRAEFERRSLANILPFIPKDEKPDILLISSPEYLPIPVDIGSFPGIKILLITDWNVCLRFLPDLLPLFDFCFTDWPGFQLLKKSGIENIYHGPLFGHDVVAFKNQGLIRDIDISFCGNLNGSLHGNRNRLLARLAKWNKSHLETAVHLRGAFGEEYRNVLNRSKMVFNYSIRGEANMRLYEAMATGAVPLIESTNQEVGIFFQEGKHYLKYDVDAFEKGLDTFINEPEKITSISFAAQEIVKDHTKSKQLQRILNSVCEMPAGIKKLSLSNFGSRNENFNSKEEKFSSIEEKFRADFSESNKSLMKLRILGLGYTLSDALVEIQNSAQNKQLHQETFLALLINLLEKNPNQNLSAAEKMVVELLQSKTVPDIVLDFYQMYFSRMNNDWENVLAAANKGLQDLNKIDIMETQSIHQSLYKSFYQYFYPPIFLGEGFNSDLNLAYQNDFFRNDNPGKTLSYNNQPYFTQLLRAHFVFAKAQALENLGSWELALDLLKDFPATSHALPSHLSNHSFASFNPYSQILKLLIKNSDIDQIKQTIQTWFAHSPLNTEAWTEMYDALNRIREWTGDISPSQNLSLSQNKSHSQNLSKKFLEEILILAEGFYSETQVNAIKAMLDGLES